MSESASFRRRVILGGALLALLSLAACATPDRPRGPQREVPKVSLNATGEFFHGQLTAEAYVGNGVMGPPKERVRGFDPRISPHAIGAMDSSPGADGRRQGDDFDLASRGNVRGRASNGMEGGMNPLGSSEPPVLLRLRLTNTGQSERIVTIRDIDSELGNFVPRPERVTLLPGQSVELEPMISRLGVVSGEIPLNLSFRSAGEVESQTVILKSTPPPAAPKPAK